MTQARLLNPVPVQPDAPPASGPRVAATWQPVLTAGCSYLLEVNSLAVYRAAPAEWPELLATVTHVPARPFSDPGECGPARFLVLNVTTGCNLRCAYCFARSSAAPATMNFDLARRAIEALFPASGPIATGIGFFGGEPLLIWPLVREVMAFAAARDPRARFSLTTNGTLLTPAIAAELAARRVSVILSLDGSRRRHDELRPLATGEGSFDLALAGLRHLAAAGIRPTLRGTYAAAGLDLASELEFLNCLCDEGLARHVSIEPAGMGDDCARAGQAVTRQRLRELLPVYRRAGEWAIARVRAGKRARFHHLNAMLRRLLRRERHASECGAGRGYLTLNSAGEIHACHRERSQVGRLTETGIEWSPARADWRDNRLEARQSCSSCGVRYLCGGGCRMDSLCANGDPRQPAGETCELTRLRLHLALQVLDAVGPEAAKLAI